MKVFGIGLSRTGTMSLSDALNQIGLHSVHFPHDPVTRKEVKEFLAGRARVPCASVLAEADAITDTPAAIGFEALDEAYPGSKFILTTREEEQWLESCRSFWRLVIQPQREAEPRSPVSIYAGLINESLYGTELFEAERFRRAKAEFEARVLRHFGGPSERLLVLDICSGHGWLELSRFLRKPMPHVRFPHSNRRESVA